MKHVHLHVIEPRFCGPDEPNVVFYETPASKLKVGDDVPGCECGWTPDPMSGVEK